MTRKKDTALAQPVNADKWERRRRAAELMRAGPQQKEIFE